MLKPANLRFEKMRNDIRLAKVRTMMFYVEKLIIKHFTRKNPNAEYGYTSNTASYEAWKMKHFGALPQLVLSGALKAAVLAGKVQRDGSVVFNVPQYGLYQLRAGRDFISPSKSDKLAMEKRFKRELARIRNNSNK